MPGAIPLHLITGFLGAGKTTLLARLIRSPGFADTAVIVNEFGAVGLDHALIAQGDESNTVLLDSGCICCTLTSSLEDTLEALYYKRERGEVPAFSRIVVETTGLADPGPIATALSSGMFTARHVRLVSIVTCIDAAVGSTILPAHEEARHQTALADRIVLTKTDMACARDLEAARTSIAAINPTASLIESAMGQVDPQKLLAPATIAVDIPSASGACGHGHHAADHLQTHGYASVVCDIDQPVTWHAYAAFVETAQRAGAGLLRVKGFVRFDDGNLYAVQGVGLVFTPPSRIDWPIAANTQGRLVLIARGVATEALRALAAILRGV